MHQGSGNSASRNTPPESLIALSTSVSASIEPHTSVTYRQIGQAIRQIGHWGF
jgi:hypothetical protein